MLVHELIFTHLIPSSDNIKPSSSQSVQNMLESTQGTLHSQYVVLSASLVKHVPWPLQSVVIVSFLQSYRDSYANNNSVMFFRM